MFVNINNFFKISFCDGSFTYIMLNIDMFLIRWISKHYTTSVVPDLHSVQHYQVSLSVHVHPKVKYFVSVLIGTRSLIG